MNNYHLEIENVGFGIYLIMFQKYIPYLGVNALLGMISSNPKAASGKTSRPHDVAARIHPDDFFTGISCTSKHVASHLSLKNLTILPLEAHMINHES